MTLQEAADKHVIDNYLQSGIYSSDELSINTTRSFIAGAENRQPEIDSVWMQVKFLIQRST